MNKNDSTGDTSRLGAAQALRERAVSATGDAFKALQASVTDTPRGHAVASGFKTLEQMPSRFAEVAASMTVGQTSALVETSGGYFILRLNNAKTIYPTSIQTGVSHILLAATDGLSMDQAQKEAERLHNMLVLNPKRFEALAKEFSADGSAANGGDLGIILPGDTVPEFERMMDLMAPGEISRPTRSQFGWHIIRTNSRETLEIPRARLLAQAKQMISQRKADTELRNWVEQLNKDAFVEYR